MADTVNWSGASGRTYQYWIHPITTTFKAVAGNYIFAKEIEPGRWRAVYIGETADLSERFDNHHKMPCIVRNGATHIHAHTNSDQNARLAEEMDLINNYRPVCNG